ncbi:hypothetical protein [Kordiimonas sp. SCSIO 12610]|uniref:hypothetical protein n=1 Tax=Kordiimonas sp. SCSIO 12610 TaxID=2829597 RepID=UPI00210A595F|nr:hypothetical protein [Kordiimonas sp. SCSIO 12610]UTW54975.1 hypothetical protein KFF44_14380 [Kordiimonas sp. SCSIO 12610]
MFKNIVKFRKVVSAAVIPVMLGLSGTAFAESDIIELSFSKYLAKRMDRISAIDKQREEVFRDFRRDGSRQAQRPRDRLNNSRFFQTEWANERLIPNLDDYSVPALIEEMMKRGIEEASPDGFNGRIVLDITELRIANFPLAAINSFNSRMKGVVKHYDENNNLIAEHKVWTALVPKFTAGRNYQGRDYAYLTTSGTTRVGPVAAEFTAKALEKIFPDYDAPDLVFLTPADLGI